MGTKRKLSPQEKAYYASPYETLESRKPVRVWPQEIPFDGESETNYEAIASYSQWLMETELPKLMIYVSPGMIIKKDEVKRIKKEFKNVEAVHVGKGSHYLQEDYPHEIGQAIADWAEKQ
jgi:haloalkane dehalogenase